MNLSDKPIDRILHDLQERAKELNCLYRVDEILARTEATTDDLLRAVLAVIPAGWQYPDVCVARVSLRNRTYEPPGFEPTPWVQSASIFVQSEAVGLIEIYYTEAMPRADEGPFLAQERKLLESLAERLGFVLGRREMQRALTVSAPSAEGAAREWWVILDFLRQTDRALLGRLGRKMINHLCWSGVEAAEALLRQAGAPEGEAGEGEENRPLPRAALSADAETTDAAFRLAGENLSEDEILSCIQSWIKEEKTTFLKHAVESLDTPLAELTDALQRFRHGGVEERDLSVATQLGLRASLVRRFLTDQLEFVNIAKQVLEVADFHELAQRLVSPAKSHGRIGGKSAGLFLAGKIVQRSKEYADVLGDIRIPRSWYIPSDGLLEFIHHNDLGEVHNRKYVEPDRIRLEYPHVVQLFKNSFFSPEMLRSLGVVLDDLEGRPIIVRSSSLLEDRLGSAFSGKYKSLFLANVGAKRERLSALTDAIAEVYASVFSPDPIEYRARRGFLALHEEMGILIQEVVGRRIGPYYLPAYSGVGFSNNEFRWSGRIRREDGLLRLVPGLGTRAVDRLADDYPMLVAPGQPGLRVNQTIDEVVRYSPKKMDVINLEKGTFETVEVADFLREHGEVLPLARQMLSIAEPDQVRRPMGFIDFERDEMVVTFEGLITDSPFVPRMRALLQVLREKLKTAVDIEFACDGEHVYLLQCRPQGATKGAAPVPIPRDLPRDRILFTAHRFVSNGQVGDVSHIVYVDPDAYGQLPLAEIKEVGRAVGRLNRILPKRQFILIGPGRWGSRGDIRLGVPVTYADISNTAVLIEVARRKGGYVPDLSFGTHFFQDLVESSIRYLPLYPDDPEVIFSELFFARAPNALADLLPESAHLAPAVKVIDVAKATDGLVLKVLMNGDLEEAVAVFGAPSTASEEPVEPYSGVETRADDHWRWRLRIAQRLAAQLEQARAGVRAIYLFGSVKNATAGPGSDIDLLIHCEPDAPRHRALVDWLEGWSRALAEVNFLRTGYQSDGLLDAHFVTDQDIARGDSYAAKIGAVTDAARPLPLGKAAV